MKIWQTVSLLIILMCLFFEEVALGKIHFEISWLLKGFWYFLSNYWKAWVWIPRLTGVNIISASIIAYLTIWFQSNFVPTMKIMGLLWFLNLGQYWNKIKWLDWLLQNFLRTETHLVKKSLIVPHMHFLVWQEISNHSWSKAQPSSLFVIGHYH